MENLRNAINLMTPNCFMVSIDLKDAYYSVSVNKNHRKYLRFIWKHQLFQVRGIENIYKNPPLSQFGPLRSGFPSSADVGGPSSSPPMLPSATDAANQPSLEAPPTHNGMQVVCDSLRARGVSDKASTVTLKSWMR